MAIRGNQLLLLGLTTLGAAWLLMACQAPEGASGAGGGTIAVAAAADLQFAFTEIGELFQQQTGRKVVFIFNSTGTLAKQIENGAPVDVFAAANIQFIDDLRAKGMLLGDTQQLYAVGRIALASAKRSSLSMRSLSDLVRPEIKNVAIANPEHAPYGVAAKQALEATGVWEQVRPKLVYGENVRQALQYIQTGNAEAGVVALSIANVPEIDYVLIDENLYQPLKQALAVVSGTKHEQASREFIAFINGPGGRPIMKKYGFLLPGEF